MNNISYWLKHCHDAEPYVLLEQFQYKHDWLALGDLGGMRARISGKFFEWDSDGDFYVMQGVWRDIPAPLNPVDEPILYDVICWHPDRPQRWHFLRGECGLILGERAVHRANICNEALQLYRTPFDWLKAGCNGAVLLDKYGLNRLYGLPELICENVEHGKSIEVALHSYYLSNIPRLSVPMSMPKAVQS